MKLFAVTYTDPCEPWGYAIQDRKLYRTPGEVVDAANNHFDEWCEQMRQYHLDHWHKYYARKGDPCTFAQYQADEWSREYGFGTYTL